jgi:hypothetical protein
VSPIDQKTAQANFPFKEVLLFEGQLITMPRLTRIVDVHVSCHVSASYPNAGTCGLPMAAILEVRR